MKNWMRSKREAEVLIHGLNQRRVSHLLLEMLTSGSTYGGWWMGTGESHSCSS